MQLVTKLVGPIAPILVKRAQKQARDFDNFSRLLAEELDAKERPRFLEAVAVLQKARANPSSSQH